MTDESKKYLSIGIVIVCLSMAGIISYRTMFGGSSAAAGAGAALLCTDCGGFEISTEEFQEFMNKNSNTMMTGQSIELECPKCNQKTCYMAKKCKDCENIFVPGQTKDQEFPDRCPECGFSQMEARQKEQ